MAELNPTDNPIVVRCKSADLLPLDQVVEFQGKLKRLSAVNRKRLTKSICTHGFIAPLFVWDNDGEWSILDGHQRVKALLWMREAGWDIPMLPVDYIQAETEDDARRKLLAITSQYGEFETSVLAEWLEGMDDDIVDTIRLVDEEIDLAISKAEEETIGDDLVDEDVEPITQSGDLWELGLHRLLCGDSTNSETVGRLMDGRKADMVFTDPPYGVGYSGGIQFKDGEARKDQRERIANDETDSIYSLAIPIMSENCCGPIYTWFASTKALKLYLAVESVGEIHSLLIWVKNGGYGALNSNYKQKHELCLYWKPRGQRLNFVGATTETTVWHIDKEGVNKLHPTQKPVELADKAIRNHSADLVWDLFMGSGSTLIAAEKRGRTCYGLELDPHYCDVIVNRYREWMAANDRECTILRNGEPWNG